MKSQSVSIYLLVLFLTIFSSCSRFYREFVPVEGYVWERTDVKKLKVKIEDNSKPYNLLVWIRHHAESPIAALPLRVKVTSPSGKIAFEADIDQEFRKTDGTLVGEAAGDYCDNEKMLKEKFNFEEKGEYTFEISLDSEDPKLPGILHVGLIVDEIKP
jgi:gliding motility-associated lipoprotein GldH